MRFGIAISGDLVTLGDLARRCEDAGFTSVWVPETARTVPVQAAVIAQATHTASIGSSVALSFVRSPVITAMAARDLAELSNGRFILGLGTQVKRVNEHRYSVPFEHPAPKMAEVIEVCREVWRAFAGDPIDHQGRFYTVTLPPFPGAGPPPAPIPIYIAAVKERMLALVGASADGFLGHPFSSPAYLRDVALPAIEAGAKGAGRSRADVTVVQSLICSPGNDVEQARWAAKAQIAFYGTTRTYRGVFEHHGFGDVVDRLRDAHARGDVAAMVDHITDEMCDTYAVAGSPEQVRAGLDRYDGLADVVMLNPPWAMPGARSDEAFGGLLDLLA